MNSRKRLWATIGTFAIVLYIIWRIFFTLPPVGVFGWLPFALGVVFLICEAFFLLDNGNIAKHVRKNPIPKHPSIPDSMYPDVDVFVNVRGNETDVAFKTINACKRLDYPTSAAVNVYVCDDEGNPELEKLAGKMGVNYVSCNEGDGRDTSLNAALSLGNAPWVAVIAGDVIPDREFLMVSLPYTRLPQMRRLNNGEWILPEISNETLTQEPRIGFIQTPQSYYNPELFLYEHHGDEQSMGSMDYLNQVQSDSKNRSNTALLMGNADVVSRDALCSVNGFDGSAPSDLMATGIRIAKAGYRNLALSKEISRGYAPTDFAGFVMKNIQEQRNLKRALSKSREASAQPLSLKSRLSFLSERWHWVRAIFFLAAFVATILLVLFQVPVYLCSMADLIFICFVVYLVYSYAVKVVSGGSSENSLRHVFGLAMLPHFVCRSSDKSGIEAVTGATVIFYVLLLVLDAVAIVAGVLEFFFLGYWGVLALVYWMAMNSVYLLLAVTFMRKRSNSRASIRVPVKAKAVITLPDNGAVFTGKTLDMSQTGVSVEMLYPIYFPREGAVADVLVNDVAHETRFSAKLVHVRQQGSTWIYGMHITSIDLYNSEELLNILHDFSGQESDEASSGKSLFARKQQRGTSKSRRKLPRIPIERTFEDINGDSWYVVNCNYEFVLLKAEGGNMLPAQLFLRIPGTSFVMECRESQKRPGLYNVVNYDDLRKRGAFDALVSMSA